MRPCGPSPRVGTGNPVDLGAAWDGEGVNFALFCEHATALELCPFDAATPARQTHAIALRPEPGRFAIAPEGARAAAIVPISEHPR